MLFTSSVKPLGVSNTLQIKVSLDIAGILLSPPPGARVQQRFCKKKLHFLLAFYFMELGVSL